LDGAVESGLLKEKEWIDILIKDRINKKEGEYIIGEKFRNFIDFAL